MWRAWISCGLQQFHDVRRDPGFKLPRFGIEDFEFLVEGFEPFLEILVAEILALRDADVAAGIERPSLGFDFGEACRLTQPLDVAVVESRREEFAELGFGAVVEFGRLAAVEADEVGDELDLRGSEVAVGAVELAEDVAGVDEEDGVLAIAD